MQHSHNLAVAMVSTQRKNDNNLLLRPVSIQIATSNTNNNFRASNDSDVAYGVNAPLDIEHIWAKY